MEEKIHFSGTIGKQYDINQEISPLQLMRLMKLLDEEEEIETTFTHGTRKNDLFQPKLDIQA